MSHPKSPALIARDALKLLATRSLPPTPANFQACYDEIAGVPAAHGNAERADDSPLAANFVAGLVRLIDNMRPALGREDAGFNARMDEFLHALRRPVADIVGAEPLLPGLGYRAAHLAEEQAEIRQTLLKLLHLVLENIGELSMDDRWLKGQVDALLTAVQPPLSLRRLDDVERRVRDVMHKQTEAKSRAVEAREEMRRMLAEFLTRLASMSESSTLFEGRLEESVRKLEDVRTIEDMAPLLKEVITATRAMSEDTTKTRAELQALQDQVRESEAALARLHMELDSASALARHDPLTEALNRKGLDEALEREIANMRRKDQPLSLSLLDIDNFKQLNDRLGHETGDAALVHLANVTRDSMRPADSLARYGGEEFVILMPDTTLEQGIQAMTRLQRELTKAFFLAGEEHILITFSAGVAQFTPEETAAEVLRRADQAMYLAKRAGKNRVIGG